MHLKEFKSKKRKIIIVILFKTLQKKPLNFTRVALISIFTFVLYEEPTVGNFLGAIYQYFK